MEVQDQGTAQEGMGEQTAWSLFPKGSNPVHEGSTLLA